MVSKVQQFINYLWGAEPQSKKHGELSPKFDASYAYGGVGTANYSLFDGDKFPGGFGETELLSLDYWTLRKRSEQLFHKNLYARGIIRRLVTNEINTGLMPEFSPDEEIIGILENSLDDWTETSENRFGIWAKNPDLCDWKRKNTFGKLQRYMRQEAHICGDILVVLHISRRNNLPSIQLINGNLVQTPLGGAESIRKGHTIKHGVEFDSVGRVSAHWVQQKDMTTKRIPAFGEKSGRRISWLEYGNDKRMDEIRGEPLLSIVLQSLKEIDRYRDSTQRKAVINSIVAMSVEKAANLPGTLPVGGGAVRKDTVTTTDGDGTVRDFNINKYLPGYVVDEMQTGEKLNMHTGSGTDLNFATFESAIIQAVAWCNEIPPEILTLAFSNNYSASQAAINEYKIYLIKVWSDIGETFCTPIKNEWLISEVLTGKIPAPGLLEAWRDPQQYDVFGAWIASDWYGSIKPSTDMLKQVKASIELIKLGLSTHAREARMTTGTKWSKNIKRLRRENVLWAEAMTPIAEFKQKFGAVDQTGDDVTASQEIDIEAMVDEYLEDRETPALKVIE